MKQHTHQIHIATHGKGLYEFTREIHTWLHGQQAKTGLLTVFCQHTSASLVIQENADPAVLRDLEKWMARLAPEAAHYEHDDEGPDDMPGHLRSAITRTSETIPVMGGRLAFGTWQALYLWEHRQRGHRRRLVVSVIGE